MTVELRSRTRALSMAAEQQMRQWAMGLEIEQRVEHEEAAERLAEEIHPYLAISRDTGAGASQLAHRVGARLGWHVLDRELLDFMAERYQLQKGMVEFADERHTSWLLEVFGKWLNQRLVTESEYVTHLGQIVLMSARHHSTVFVGRGAQFFLPRDRGLKVQILAPLAQRIDRIMQRERLERPQAVRYLEEKDRARRDFVREHFHHDVTDPHLYDLVINLEHLTAEDAIELIVEQCVRCFGDAAAAGEPG